MELMLGNSHTSAVRSCHSASHALHTSATPHNQGGKLNGLQGMACTLARGVYLASLSELAWYLFCASVRLAGTGPTCRLVRLVVFYGSGQGGGAL
jgi:hypothetical protein